MSARPACAAVLATWLVIAVAPASAGLPAPKPATISNGEGAVRGTLVSYCVATAGGPGEPGQGVCADFVPPPKPPKPRLDVEPRQRLTIDFRDVAGLDDEVKKVAVDLLAFGGGGAEFVGKALRAKAGPKGTWRVRLPGDLADADGISVFARFADGDATSFAGIR